MDNMAGLRERLCDYREELAKIIEAIGNLEDDIAEEILLIDLREGKFTSETKDHLDQYINKKIAKHNGIG
jgi:hypothetical protein